MAKQYDNTNTGALFKNDKQGNDKRPDYKGTINVNGTEFWLSAWIKHSKDGMAYMQMAVQPKEARGDAPKPKAQKAGDDWATEAEDLPF